VNWTIAYPEHAEELARLRAETANYRNTVKAVHDVLAETEEPCALWTDARGCVPCRVRQATVKAAIRILEAAIQNE